jgi:hypothetical protein
MPVRHPIGGRREVHGSSARGIGINCRPARRTTAMPQLACLRWTRPWACSSRGQARQGGPFRGGLRPSCRTVLDRSDPFRWVATSGLQRGRAAVTAEIDEMLATVALASRHILLACSVGRLLILAQPFDLQCHRRTASAQASRHADRRLSQKLLRSVVGRHSSRSEFYLRRLRVRPMKPWSAKPSGPRSLLTQVSVPKSVPSSAIMRSVEAI